MAPIINFDLFSLGIGVAAAGLLGFVVLFSDSKSATNRAFFFFSLMTIFYSTANYLQYHFSVSYALMLLRLTIFFAVWHAFSLFNLFYIFPRSQVSFSRKYKFILLPIVIFTSLLTLSPLVFAIVKEVSGAGSISKISNGPGIVVFAATVFYLVVGGVAVLVRKTIKAVGLEKDQFLFVSFGTLTTFSLLIVFNFILPAFFDISQFISFAPLFLIPFSAFTFYAILKYRLLNVKIISTEILTFVLAIVTLFEVILSRDPLVLIFRSSVFILVLSFGILLIKSVLREVKQREQLQELANKLKSANDQLEELSHFKTQLLSIASHQIKSPLAAIKGFVSNLIEGLYGPVSDQVKETLTKVKKSADDLIQLINSLLDFRRVEEGKMDYKFAPAVMKDLVHDMVERLRPLASEKKLEFTFISASDASVSADAEKLTQVVQNLVDNAIKYTVSGFVKVELKEDGQYVVLSVSDSGYGIPANLIPHLFEEFVRDEKVKRQVRGTGLGLYIARKIIEAHGGEIRAESEGEGKGSTFYVKLRKL